MAGDFYKFAPSKVTMKKIGLLSDTHGYLDERILHFLSGCDEIWHAGDFGGGFSVAEGLEKIAPLKAVYGNIDGADIRSSFPEVMRFECEGMKILMIHIAGSPGKYFPNVRHHIEENRPDVFVCGHSHIIKVMRDPKYNFLYINPGAAGKHGFHKVRTLLLFEIDKGKIAGFKVIELGPRASLNA
jgi:putative phosphoesterase